MGTLKQDEDRKLELLERYRAARLDEILDELREQAAEEAERDRYPWRGRFRPRAEIEQLYKERRRWDRRFLIDLTLVAVLLVAVILAGKSIVKSFMPRSAYDDAAGGRAEAEQ